MKYENPVRVATTIVVVLLCITTKANVLKLDVERIGGEVKQSRDAAAIQDERLPEQKSSSAAGSKQDSSRPQVDLSGLWAYQRKGGRTKGIVKGTLELSRASDIDKDGYTAFRGANRQAPEKTAPPPEATKKENPWIVAIKEDKVVICMDGLCAAFPCAGSLTKEGEIVARCKFTGFSTNEDSGWDLGEFRAKRVQQEKSTTPNQ